MTPNRKSLNLEKIEMGDSIVILKSFDGEGVQCKNGSTMFGVTHEGDDSNLFMKNNDNTKKVIGGLTEMMKGARATLSHHHDDTYSINNGEINNVAQAQNTPLNAVSQPNPTPTIDDRTHDIHRQVAFKEACKMFGPTDETLSDEQLSIIKANTDSLLANVLEYTAPIIDDDVPF